MKKTITSVLAALVGIGAATAAELTPAQALARVQSNAGARKIIGRSATKTPQLIAQLPELYVFSTGEGFMILPADDVATPLLAYADATEFAPEEIPALKWWLSTYSAQIAAASAAGISTQSDEIDAPERAAIAPLLKTTWNQDAPYYNLCPMENGRNCYTGCVATAMAQVMKYYNYPAKGQGSITYSWNGTSLSMDFSATTFDWENMLDSYNTSTAEQDAAVATLMKAAGYSVNMDYSTQGSGAYAIRIGGALINYFDYDKGITQPQRDYYELTDWEDLIYADLAAGRPVIYGGASNAGGHQFVCDGYSSDGFFHFNWGWGGMSDGYFKLDALNPGSQGIGGFAGGYNMGQSVCLGVQPPVEGSKPVYMLGADNDFQMKSETVQLGGYAIINSAMYNVGALNIPAGSEIDLEFTPVVRTEPTYVKCQTTPELKPGEGYGSLYALIPTTMAEGTYTVRPVFKAPGGDWQRVQFPLSMNSELTATIANSKASFVAESKPGFTITDLPEDKTIYIGSTFALTMTLTNNTSTEYLGSMYPIIIKSDSNDEIGWGSQTPVQLAGDESKSFEYVGSLTAANGETLTPGKYRLYFFSQQSQSAICDPVAITLADMPLNNKIEVTDFSFDGIVNNTAKFTWKVTCTEGYYDKDIRLYILDSGNRIATYRDVDLYLSAGESKDITVEIDLGDLDYGNYSAALMYDNALKERVAFAHVETTTSIESVTAGEQTDAAIYDLQGRRVTHPTPGRLYIRANTLIRLK